MAEELIVPKLGMAAAVATLTKWQVAEGGWVEKGDTVLDIEAEKSTFEMPAPIGGFLHILFAEGIETDVNTVVGLIAATKQEYEALCGTSTPAGGDADGAALPPSSPVAKPSNGDGSRIFITPIARRMAKENEIDISTITGSGARGRIQRDDVARVIAASQDARATASIARAPQATLGTAAPASAPEPATAKDNPAPAAVIDGRIVREVTPYKGMRKVIGDNMMRSLAINAPNTMSGDFDLTVMAKYRDNFVLHESRLGTRITYADMMMYAVSRALKQFPLMNSSIVGDEIRLWDEVNLGMAVALGEYGEKGLVVPVIQDADRKSLVEISKETKDLGTRARSGKLQPQEMRGGTFTVSNFGSLGVSSYSTPIINVPESGILGIGRLQKKPIVRGEGIVVAPMLPYSLTHDHRVTDGAAAERFLTILKTIVESTSAELSELILF